MHPTNRKDCEIDLTNAAYQQIKLIRENDFTLDKQYFRLKIGGKGCDGFTYETGFSEKLDDDIVLIFNDLEILVDPFTFHYCKTGYLDFLLNPKNNEDGFVFINANEAQYHGKFFKDESMTPPSVGSSKTKEV